MNILRFLIPGRDDKSGACFPCAHLLTDAPSVEAALAGLATLSSAHASVRAGDGLCLLHDRVVNGTRRCAAFERPGN